MGSDHFLSGKQIGNLNPFPNQFIMFLWDDVCKYKIWYLLKADSDSIEFNFHLPFFPEAINLRRRQGRQANPDQSVTAAENKIALSHISDNLWLALIDQEIMFYLTDIIFIEITQFSICNSQLSFTIDASFKVQDKRWKVYGLLMWKEFSVRVLLSYILLFPSHKLLTSCYSDCYLIVALINPPSDQHHRQFTTDEKNK